MIYLITLKAEKNLDGPEGGEGGVLGGMKSKKQPFNHNNEKRA